MRDAVPVDAKLKWYNDLSFCLNFVQSLVKSRRSMFCVKSTGLRTAIDHYLRIYSYIKICLSRASRSEDLTSCTGI